MRGGSSNAVILALIEYIKSINTITDRDYAEVVSTFTTLTEPKYRCHDCKLKHSKDEAKFNRHKQAMACDYLADKPRHQYRPEFNNLCNPKVLYNKCIGNYYNGYFAVFINDYIKFKEGLLPFEGGLYDQPAKFAELYSLVDNLIRENEQILERKQKMSKINGR